MEKKEKEDCRSIGDDLLLKLKNGGFKEFLNFVKKNENKLALCFRGNKNYVAIYYKNHCVWKLSKSINDELRVSISFNHARYTNDWEEKLKVLYNEYGFNSVCKKEKLQKKYHIFDEDFDDNKLKLEGLKKAFKIGLESNDGYLTTTRDYFSKDFVEGSYKILEKIIEDHFCTEKTTDYFKGISGVTHSNKKEKIRQHELFLNNSNTENGLFIYDLEFTQKNAKQYEISNGQPDMLAIRFEKGKPKALVLIEVKSQKKAINGKSGLDVHLEYMRKYKENIELVNNRRNEAYKIFEQYKYLGLRHIDKKIELGNIQNLPIEIGIILTDEATQYYKENKEKLTNKYKIINEDENEICIIERD